MNKAVAGLLGCCLVIAGAWFVWDPGNTDQSGVSGLSITEQAAEQEKLANRDDLPSQNLIASGDLPPAGTRSVFDHHIAQLGELPYPFSDLLDSFRSLDRWQQGSVSLLIPDGRSLAKGHADYYSPRVLSAVQIDPLGTDGAIAPVYSGRLFLGFVEAIDTLEIIAYNEAAGRFEFQLVQNYCEGCTPRILYAKRAICTACHQAGDPIFAVRPWSETNAHPEVAKRIAARQDVPWSQASRRDYEGVRISTQIVTPETFDELVRLAGEISLAQRVWLDGCGEKGLACRRALLTQALSLLMNPGGFDPASVANQKLRKLQAESWPAHGIAVPDNSLPDRVPETPSFLDARLLPVKRFWADLFKEHQDRDGPDARLADFERLPRIPLVLDPLSAREPLEILDSTSLRGVHAIASLFIPQDRELLNALTETQAQKIGSLIGSGALDHLLRDQPVNRVAILQAISSELIGSAPEYCCLDTASMAPAAAEDESELAIQPGSVLQVFERYCFDCHRGNPVERLNFMAGETEEAVLESIRRTRRIREVLDYAHASGQQDETQLMPPPSSIQRAHLDASREQNSGDLERMLEAMNTSDEDQSRE